MATRETKTQVYPGISHLEAFLTTLRLGFDIVNLIEVRAACHCGFFFQCACRTAPGLILCANFSRNFLTFGATTKAQYGWFELLRK